MRAEKRLSNGWYFLTSYTYSKALDLGSTDDSTLTSNNYKQHDKGPGDFDVRHRAVFSYVYELPFGHGKHFLANAPRLVDKLLGGWQLNGITTVSTGQYKTVGLPHGLDEYWTGQWLGSE